MLRQIRNTWWNGWESKKRYVCNSDVVSQNRGEIVRDQRLNDPIYLEYYGHKMYSQNDEDGIIEEIFRRIGCTNKIFLEIGVNNGMECCTHCLLYKDWTGGWIECGEKFVMEIMSLFKGVIDSGKLIIEKAFVNKSNINGIVRSMGMSGEIDLLSIDIVGNDYYIWDELSEINPRVVVIPYNAKVLPSIEWVMPYNANYIWDGSDYQYASLKSIELLGKQKGYTLVGTNINGVNAFMVRSDLIKDGMFPSPSTAEHLYNPARRNLFFESGRGGEASKIPLLTGMSL